ncbi:cAMP-dependent protein kinase catalytic subunit [Actinomyces denticolens]|nr:cAMP-dependent protein kinase catalytic subunit [Actinomyces denticolens]
MLPGLGGPGGGRGLIRPERCGLGQRDDGLDRAGVERRVGELDGGVGGTRGAEGSGGAERAAHGLPLGPPARLPEALAAGGRDPGRRGGGAGGRARPGGGGEGGDADGIRRHP